MKHINKPLFHILLIVIAVFGLYWQTTRFEFVLDDKIVITENNFVKKGTAGIKEIFANDSMNGFLGKNANLLEGGRYRPLSLAVFAVGYEFFGPNNYYFHLLNIVFYLISCLLLYQTLLLLFKKTTGKNSNIKFYSFVATILFAVHPTHSEAVANIKGLDEILALLFGVGALFFTFLYFDKNKIIYPIIGGVSFLLGLLAKESTLPLLVAIPVALYFFRNSSLKVVLKSLLILLVPTLIYLHIRYNAMGFLLNNDIRATGIMNNPYFDATTGQKTATILFTLLLYLKLLFFPHPLTHDYYPYHIKLLEIYHPYSILALVILGFLIWFAIKGIKTRNKLAYIIFFFFITLSIVSNVVINVGAFMNERFLFIPSIAFSIFVVYLFERYSGISKIKTVLFIITGLMLAGFTYKSANRIPAWENEKSLNITAIKVSKNSARANCFYGVSIYNEILKDSIPEVKLAKTYEAQKFINRSLEIYPEYSDALRMKAGLAAEEYKISKDVEPLLDVFREILSVKYLPYVDEFSNWLERRTDKNLMTDFYFDAGYRIFAVKHQNFTIASNYLQKGYKLLPNHRGILFGSCIVNFLTGNITKAIEFGIKYIEQFGDNPEIYYYVGNAQIKSGQPQIGLQNLEKAYQLNPELKNRKVN